MASELLADHLTAKNVYFQVRNAVGAIWNGAAFVAYATADVANYDVAAVEQGVGSGLYAGDMPAVAEGIYNIVAKERAGGSPAESDVTVGVGEIAWTGTAVSDTVAQAGLQQAVKSITRFVVGNGSTTTSVITSSMTPPASVASQFSTLILAFASDTTTAALRGQKTDITASTNAGILTVTGLTNAPVSGDYGTIE